MWVPERPTTMLPAHWVVAVVSEKPRVTTSTSGWPLVKTGPSAVGN